MSLIFKSKLIRHEIKHWLLIASLLLWGITGTVYAFTKSQKIILIGIDEAGTRLVTASSDRLLQSELKNFLKTFFDAYYVYDEKNYLDQIGKATEIMTDELWQKNKDRLLELHEKLQKNPLSQSMEIESIDLVEASGQDSSGAGTGSHGKIESVLVIKVHSRLVEQKVRLKVNIEFKKHERDEKNPWGFEITELTDAVI